nr:S-layer homology domain-containing protein [Pseudoflavonifractor phocaeensis]
MVSILCVLALCLTLLPVTALAAGGGYLALGDSITTGYAPGNTAVSSPFAGQVQAMGGYASLTNRAAEGETTQTLKDRLPGLSGDIAGASLITITIGGNDLMNALYGYLVDSYNTKNPTKPITLESLKAALMDLSQLGNQLMLMGVISYIGGFDGSSAETAALDTFEANLGEIIDQIRWENPSAPIVIATQYNPYRHITDQSAQGIAAAFETGVVHLNERLTKVAGEKGLLVADVYTAFRDDGGQLTNAAFSMSDLQNASLDFHPNQAGHNKIAAVIYGALPGESRKTIMLGTSGISGWDSTNGYDYIYFGNWTAPDGNTTYGPIKWRVLDDQTNTGETGLFLLSDELLGTGSYGGVYFDSTSPYGNAWQGSDAQDWCKTFYSDSLTTQEQSAVLETTKSDTAFTSSTYSVPFAASENILNGDKVFFLSAEEAENSAYGFQNDTARIANYGNSAGVWWLRSPHAYSTDRAGAVNSLGIVYIISVYYFWAARPAFNLNRNSVLFTSAAVGGKIPAASSVGNQGAVGADAIFEIGDYAGSEWKLTLLDSSREFAISDAKIEGSKIDFSYSNAQTGTNEYISVVIEDEGEITHYGRILQLGGASGTASLTLPAGVTLDDDTKLYVFNEQYNGGENDDTKRTDYGSKLIEVNPTVDDTAPTLTAGTATRTSETTATVKFTSDEAGDFYYEVVESGEAAPTIDTSGAGTACISGKNTIFLTTLSGAGAKELYMVAKDAVGNVSDTLQIKIPEYIPPVYGISADTNVDFGTVTEGYDAPAEQTVTIRNTGNQPVTLTQPVDTASFTVGALSSAELAVGQTAAFTVRPKTGLAPGTYSETLALAGQSGTYSVGTDVALRFVVEQRDDGQEGGGSSGGGSSSGGGGAATYSATVAAADHGTVTVSPKNAAKGSTVTITVTPEQGYQLDTLTVTDSQGNQLKLTGQGEGKFTFTMPGGPVTVQAVFAPIPEEPEQPLPFTDVDETAWYYDGVRYVYEKGLMTGTSAADFSPGTTTSRSMVAAILWRMAGSPQVDYIMDYADVEQGQWYSEAVRWAASEGIVGGYGNGLFGTNDPITREQLAVMLYRFAQKQGYDVSVGENTNILSYTDAAQVSEWAIPALQWACGGGLITGTGDGSTLTPQGDTTRAEAAVLLMRFCEAYVTW